MNKNREFLLMLLNCSIRKKKPWAVENKNINWTYIIAEAKAHEIYPLLYPVIKELDSSHALDKELKESWKRTTITTAIYFANQIPQWTRVFKKLGENRIPVIALKGLILRYLYPTPDLRTMGDADILVHEEDLHKVETILAEMGYIKTEDSTPAHIAFIHKKYSPIEVHWKLADTRYIKDIASFEKDVWNNTKAKNIGYAQVLSLCPEDFLIHLCLHMAVHMRSGGFGLRQLCDLVLLIESEVSTINWQYFTLKVKQYNIEKFTTAILGVCSLIFDLKAVPEFDAVPIDRRHIKMLLNDIFDSGVFGMKSLDRVFGNNLLNAEVVYNGEISNKMGSVINLIFPPVATLSDTYSYAKKYKILTPIAWIHHFFAGLFNKQYKLLEKLNFLIFSTSIFRKRNKLIKNLEL